jgi:hypothetical protein
MLEVLIILLSLFALFFFFSLQFFLSGKFLHWFLNRISKGVYRVDWIGGGLHFPLMYFRMREIRIFFPGKDKTDIIEITAKELKGRVSFTNLIRGKFVIRHADLIQPKGTYINRQPSEEKVELLPRRGLILIQKANIENGELYIEDRNMTPIYKIQLSQIFVKNLNMDCGSPMSFLFQSEYGRCKLGDKGRLFVEKSDETKGTITLTGATWTDLAGLKVIPVPILNDRIDLRAQFVNHYAEESVSVKGTLRNSDTSDHFAQELLTNVESQDSKDRASSFRLEILWSEYSLPFDLALKKLLLEIFVKLKIRGVVGFTIHSVTKGIVNIFTRSTP